MHRGPIMARSSKIIKTSYVADIEVNVETVKNRYQHHHGTRIVIAGTHVFCSKNAI